MLWPAVRVGSSGKAYHHDATSLVSSFWMVVEIHVGVYTYDSWIARHPFSVRDTAFRALPLGSCVAPRTFLPCSDKRQNTFTTADYMCALPPYTPP